MPKLFEIWPDTVEMPGAIRGQLPWNLQLLDGKVAHFKTERAAEVYRDAVDQAQGVTRAEGEAVTAEPTRATLGSYHNYAFIGTQEMLDAIRAEDPDYNPGYIRIINPGGYSERLSIQNSDE